MTAARFEFGDRVVHRARPEWGVGTIARVEDVVVREAPAQRVAVRFANAGLKTLNTAQAPLEPASEASAVIEDEPRATVADFDSMRDSGWLASVAERKVKEAMIELPETVRDPFAPLEVRVRRTLDLYRFERTGRSLIDWAVAQSGLDDPLTRFTRHELEVHFDRWAQEREAYLRSLLAEGGPGWTPPAEVLEGAPGAGVDIVRRRTARR